MNPVYKTGHIAAILSLSAVAAYGIVQVMQVLKLLAYPLDELLIYSTSLCIAIPFLVMTICFHYTIPPNRQLWSAIAVSFATGYVVFAFMVYGVQLTVVLPADESVSGINYLRVTPNSFFWTLDALAYLFMGLTALFFLPTLKHIKSVRYLLYVTAAHVVMTVVSMVVYFYPHFSNNLLLIGSPWLLTACGMCIGMSVYFRREKLFSQ